MAPPLKSCDVCQTDYFAVTVTGIVNSPAP